ncbi:hypothetical protein D5086_014959 [Populus alba]|uniref:Uncharacterized protein n=1 Tax=Populus alba TaxID=43335 RepID=A0ACC4BZ11_POPAL
MTMTFGTILYLAKTIVAKIVGFVFIFKAMQTSKIQAFEKCLANIATRPLGYSQIVKHKGVSEMIKMVSGFLAKLFEEAWGERLMAPFLEECFQVTDGHCTI